MMDGDLFCRFAAIVAAGVVEDNVPGTRGLRNLVAREMFPEPRRRKEKPPKVIDWIP